MSVRSLTSAGKPNRRGSCESKTSKPTAARKPPITGTGIAFTIPPRRSTPKAICIKPARKVTAMSPEKPCSATMASVIGASATSGPVIW